MMVVTMGTVVVLVMAAMMPVVAQRMWSWWWQWQSYWSNWFQPSGTLIEYGLLPNIVLPCNTSIMLPGYNKSARALEWVFPPEQRSIILKDHKWWGQMTANDVKWQWMMRSNDSEWWGQMTSNDEVQWHQMILIWFDNFIY